MRAGVEGRWNIGCAPQAPTTNRDSLAQERLFRVWPAAMNRDRPGPTTPHALDCRRCRLILRWQATAATALLRNHQLSPGREDPSCERSRRSHQGADLRFDAAMTGL